MPPSVAGYQPHKALLEYHPPNSTRTAGAVAVPKKQASQPTPKPLQFVNITDPKQQKNDKNKKLVRSQAMRDFRKRQAAAKPLTPPDESSASSGSSGSGSRRMSASGALSGPITPPLGVSDGVWTQVRQPMSPRMSLITCLGAGFVDPFAQAAVETKPYMYGLMEHFIRWLTPGQTPKQRAENQIVTTLVPLARSYPALFHAAISAAASNITSERGGKEPDVWSFFHRGSALHLLNESLSIKRNRTSDATIATILLLSSCDHYFGNGAAFTMHKNAVKSIIVARGGLDKLGLNGILKRVILWMSLSGAGTTPQTPHIKARVDSATSDGSESLAIVANSSTTTPNSEESALPPSITHIQHAGLISGDVQTVIQVACTMLKYSKTRDQLPKMFEEYIEAASGSKEQEISSLLPNVFKHLSNLSSSAAASAKGSVEHCFLIAATIYFSYMLKGVPVNDPLLEQLSKTLASALQVQTYDRQWASVYGLRMWVCVVGDASSYADLDRRSFYVQDVCQLMETHTPRMTYADFVAECGNWIWDPLYEPAAQGLWELVSNSRSISL